MQDYIFSKELDALYNELKVLPLYKRRAKEEVFLGILKSKSKKWIGWKYLKEFKKTIEFKDDKLFQQFFELALNYYWLKSLKSKIDANSLLKNYKF